MLENLYKNIGIKIKEWAYGIFFAETVIAVIAAIALFINKYFLAGILTFVLGPYIAWVSSWLLYAFGQLVDDIHAMRNQASTAITKKQTNHEVEERRSIQISKTALSLKVGDTHQLTATVFPANASNKNLIWSSSNASVAQVSSNGKIIAKGEGAATIAVITVDGNYAAKCTITVQGSHATEPTATEPPIIEPVSDVLIISNVKTISNQTIDTDVYITSKGVATFNNVTVNGNIYCYGQLVCSSCTSNNVYAYAYSSMMNCEAFDGIHGKVSGGISCKNMAIFNNALNYAFNKWGKQ